jgi:spore coat protein U-like protein
MAMKVMTALLAAGAVAAAGAAWAVEATGSMDVTATVANSCTVNSPALAFGTYTADSNKDESATITISCSGSEDVTLTLNNGANADDPFTTRRMISATTSEFLNYGLSAVSSGGTAFPGAGITVEVVGGTPKDTTLYGRIPLGQYAVDFATDYTDTVGITVTYNSVNP